MNAATPPALISINEAAQQGIERLRQPQWALSMDHLKIDIIDGAPGPWLKVFAPFNVYCNGSDPVPFLAYNYDLNTRNWQPYDGPLPDSEEYQAQITNYTKAMAHG